MLKRIPSNREPGVTLWTEIHREFAQYFGKANVWLRGVVQQNGLIAMIIMIIALLISLFLSFTVFYHSGKNVPQHIHPVTVAAPVHEGIDQILDATRTIRETVKLKHFIDSIASKKPLTAADSLALDSALSRFEQLRNAFIHH
jgi:hypothetical protein